MKAILIAAVLAAAPVSALAAPNVLTGTWTLLQADILHPDGTRAHDYGDAPAGLMVIDDTGHYAVQIYDTSRPKFAAKDKVKGTPEEYRAAALGASIHYGTIVVDAKAHTFTINLVRSSYPNQEGTSQVRPYELKDGVLSYKVTARANGDVPVSVWKKVQ